MSTNAFDPSDHPRSRDGRFEDKPEAPEINDRLEAPVAVLDHVEDTDTLLDVDQPLDDGLDDAFSDIDGDSDDDVTIEELYAHAQRAAGKLNAIYGTSRRGYLEADDIVNDAMEQYLRRLQNGDRIEHPRRWVSGVARRIASRAGQHVRQEDRRAYRLYHLQVAEGEQLLGRVLTSAEKKRIEQAIYDEWHDPRRKPSRNYLQSAAIENTMKSLSVPDDPDRPTIDVADHNSPEQILFGTSDTVDPDDHMGMALRTIDGEFDRRELTRRVYPAFASRKGLPIPVSGTFSERVGLNLQKEMDRHAGGPADIVDRWQPGASDPMTEKFFAPWNTTDESTRGEVIEFMRSLDSDYVAKMWESARINAQTQRDPAKVRAKNERRRGAQAASA